MAGKRSVIKPGGSGWPCDGRTEVLDKMEGFNRFLYSKEIKDGGVERKHDGTI